MFYKPLLLDRIQILGSRTDCTFKWSFQHVYYGGLALIELYNPFLPPQLSQIYTFVLTT